MRNLRTFAVAITVCLPALPAPAAGAATTITVGSSLITRPTITQSFSGGSVTVANAAVADPEAHAVSPVDGTVVRWRLAPQPSAGASYNLDILRPTGVFWRRPAPPTRRHRPGPKCSRPASRSRPGT